MAGRIAFSRIAVYIAVAVRSFTESPFFQRVLHPLKGMTWKVIGACLLILGADQQTVWSQDFERIAPKMPQKNQNTVELPSKTPAEENDERVLVTELKGLVFVQKQEQVLKGGVAAFEGVKTEGLDRLQGLEFRNQMQPFLGQPVTLKRLNEMTREVVLCYRRLGFPVVDVIVPADQDITDGVVQVLVVEGHLGKVTAEGARWFSTANMPDEITMKRGSLFEEDQLIEDLAWINNNPFRQVEPVLSRGTELAETDLLLQVKDRFPVRVYAGYEDTGTDLTGDERWYTGVNWGNAFLLDHQLNYQFTTASDLVKLVAHSGSYVMPLPWRHTMTFFGSYATTKADIANPLFNLSGRSWQVSGRYAVPLPRTTKFTETLTAGFDFKQSNNNLEFGGAQVFNTTTDVDQWSLDYTGELQDPWGSTRISLTGFYSPGGITTRNRDSLFTATRAFAKAEYAYGRFSGERVTRLPGDFSWLVRGVYQLSEANLLGSEQLGLGGANTVRGYEEREANGDSGYLVSMEIRTPPVSLGTTVGIPNAVDQLQLLGFWDYGVAENYALLPGEDPHVQLSSVGPGLRYSINPWFSVRFDYGWQLYDTALSTRFNSRGHLGVMFSY